jgi:chromosome segregation ATPase
MKNLVVAVLVVLAGVVALGYWRGWFNVTKEGTTHVQVDRAKFEQDKEAFGKTVGKKTKALKEELASLWTKAEGLTGDDKAHAKTELAELEKKHERLEKQLKELEDASSDKFDSIKQDLSNNLREVEQKIEELTKKLAKGKDK